MAEEGFKRKLTAILSDETARYRLKMPEDEVRPIHTLTTYDFEIITLGETVRGHVQDATGDKLLSEFSSGLVIWQFYLPKSNVEPVPME